MDALGNMLNGVNLGKICIRNFPGSGRKVPCLKLSASSPQWRPFFFISFLLPLNLGQDYNAIGEYKKMASIRTDHAEEISDETQTTSQAKGGRIGKDEDYEDGSPVIKDSVIVHPEPSLFESWIPGGYNQSRMLRFKNPMTLYRVLNFFAGEESV